MKRKIPLIFLLFLLLLTNIGIGQQKQFIDDVTVAVGTRTAVMAGGWCPTRKYYAVGNWSDTYLVFHATWQITQADIQSLVSLTMGNSKEGSGIPLSPYREGLSILNIWTDQYNIWYSSWYVLVSSAAATATDTAVKANVTYRQRK